MLTYMQDQNDRMLCQIAR